MTKILFSSISTQIFLDLCTVEAAWSGLLSWNYFHNKRYENTLEVAFSFICHFSFAVLQPIRICIFITWPLKTYSDPASHKFGHCATSNTYGIAQRGSIYQHDFRTYITGENGDIVSPFHDIPLRYCQANSTSSDLVRRCQI